MRKLPGENRKFCSKCDVELFEGFKSIGFHGSKVYFCYKCAKHQDFNIYKKKKVKGKKKRRSKGKTSECTCQGCNEKFERRKHEKWKKLCLPCWKKNQQVLDELNMELDRLTK